MAQLALYGGSPTRTEAWPRWPQWDSSNQEKIHSALQSTTWGGYSPLVEEFERDFAKAHQAKHCIAVSNGTVSLMAALKVLGIGPGDEVIVPAYTFVATASMVSFLGATPVFVDIDKKDFNISIDRIREAISDKTRAVIPVHFAGQPASMEELCELANQNNLSVIEDCAHATLASRSGRSVGTFGDFGSFSFQERKNLTCGEGGALITNDDDLAASLWSFVNQGRRSSEQLWYGHESIGTNLRITAVQAAILQGQMTKLAGEQKKRQESISYLNQCLSESGCVDVLPVLRETTAHGSHIYVMKWNFDENYPVKKKKIIHALRAEGLDCTHGYQKPLYHQACFENQKIQVMDCPVTEEIVQRTVCLPHPLLLSDKNGLEQAVEIVLKVHKNMEEIRTHQKNKQK
ncbi:MAG: DegT/DnrJ/EryC1/StrS family aminotransferase [Pseudomonadota bacterium]